MTTMPMRAERGCIIALFCQLIPVFTPKSRPLCLPGQPRSLIHVACFRLRCSGLATASKGKSIRWVFLFGLWLRLWLCFVSAVCFAVSAGETQVWLGDLRVVAFGWLWLLFLLLQSICRFQGLSVLAFAFHAYSHVRTEPQRDIGHTRGKKIFS